MTNSSPSPNEPARLHATRVVEPVAAWAQLPEMTDAAALWLRKAGPDHLEEHVPRLESWLTELESR